MSIKRDLEFLFEVGCFRFIDRMWKRFLNPDFANNTEHSFRVAFIALMLSKYEKVKIDEGKLLKMALMHDLAESRTGDVDYLARQYVVRNEKLGFADIVEDTIFESELLELLEEYEKRESFESKLVKDADTLDIDLELKEQESRGFSIVKLWTKHRKQNVAPKIFTNSAKKLFKEIYKTNPHDWHNKSKRNRVLGGDWKKTSGQKQK